MDKIICDLCGTSYPDTAVQCPICGTARPDASKQQSADMTADAYAYVRGGRFSKSNVRRRANGKPENRRAAAPAKSNQERQAPAKSEREKQTPAKPAQQKQGPSNQPGKSNEIRKNVPQPQEEEGSNRGLVIVVVVLLVAIIAMVAFVAFKFISLSKAGGHNASSSTSGDPSQISCKSLHVDQTELVFTTPNKTVLLQATTNPVNTTDVVTFTSSDENVVKVDADGLVTPVADGEAIITISCGSHRLECKVTCEMGIEAPPATEPPVTEPPVTEPPVTDPDPTEPDPTEPDPTEPEPTEPDVPTPSIGFCLNRVDFTLNGYGATWDLSANSPDQYGNNYEGPADVSEVTWTSSDPTIATVENGVVTAVGNGKTYIIAEYNGQRRECIVRCVNATAPSTDVGGGEDVGGEDNPGGEVTEPLYALDMTDISLNPGEACYRPLRLVEKETGRNVLDVTYVSSDPSVCTVDENGNIVAQADAAGRATTIVVTYGDETYSCIVRVRAG